MIACTLHSIYRESFLKQYVNECDEDNTSSETILSEEDDNTALLHRRRTTRKLQMRGTLIEDTNVDHQLEDDIQQPSNPISPRIRCNTADHQVSSNAATYILTITTAIIFYLTSISKY